MIDRIDLARGSSLWLADIGEPRNNDLRVVVVEARPGPETQQTDLGPATPIRPNRHSRAFELIWYNYVAYSIRNESYFKREAGEIPGGASFGVRQDSAYMAYVAASTFATNDHPGPLSHWFLYTDWHCLDVIGIDPPDIRQLDPAETAAQVARHA